MRKSGLTYRGVFSSDWSECLSPNGPFDPIAFTYPDLKEPLSAVFKDYTGNRISLGQAVTRIKDLLPEPFTPDQMDAYLDAEFRTYTAVPDLMEWCAGNRVLFMINTTGTQGYFQRAFAKELLPKTPVAAASLMIRFAADHDDGRFVHEILETGDKPAATEALIRSLGLSARQVIVMGDSGGDGPHFQWAAAAGAFTISSMAKPSLLKFCAERGISINKLFGHTYAPGEARNPDAEMKVNFLELTSVIEDVLA